MSESPSGWVPPWPRLWPGAPLLYFVNRMIRSEPWASSTLAPFAGKTVLIELKPFATSLGVNADGTLARAHPGVAIDLRIGIPARELSAMAMAPERAGSLVEIDGDTAFAQALAQVQEHLRPDLEEGLSRLLGDVMAMRVLAVLRDLKHGAAEVQRRLAANTAEYLLDESDALIRPVEVEQLSAMLRVLRDDLARLEKRIERLSPKQ